MTPRRRTVTSGLSHQLETGRRLVGVLQEIEAPDFVRAVVRAVARADAPVVRHLVETLVAVGGRPHRADELTGGLLAVHARDRLKVSGGVGCVFALRSTDRYAASASRVHGEPLPCPRPECCSPPGTRRCRRRSRCKGSDRSPCPRRSPHSRLLAGRDRGSGRVGAPCQPPGRNRDFAGTPRRCRPARGHALPSHNGAGLPPGDNARPS